MEGAGCTFVDCSADIASASAAATVDAAAAAAFAAATGDGAAAAALAPLLPSVAAWQAPSPPRPMFAENAAAAAVASVCDDNLESFPFALNAILSCVPPPSVPLGLCCPGPPLARTLIEVDSLLGDCCGLDNEKKSAQVHFHRAVIQCFSSTSAECCSSGH